MKQMLAKMDPFPTSSNYVKLSNLDIDIVSIHEYDDPLEMPFILEVYHKEGESNAKFILLEVKGRILKIYPRNEKYYDEVRILLVEKREIEKIDPIK